MEMEFLDRTVTEDFTVIEPIQCSHEVKWTLCQGGKQLIVILTIRVDFSCQLIHSSTYVCEVVSITYNS